MEWGGIKVTNYLKDQSRQKIEFQHDIITWVDLLLWVFSRTESQHGKPIARSVPIHVIEEEC